MTYKMIKYIPVDENTVMWWSLNLNKFPSVS
uniref:Uncharacterized protein n=1 Tax=Lepeophtheirus salmonis TaxID=72036 RepID=A0A0K2TUG0_LEPSM